MVLYDISYIYWHCFVGWLYMSVQICWKCIATRLFVKYPSKLLTMQRTIKGWKKLFCFKELLYTWSLMVVIFVISKEMQYFVYFNRENFMGVWFILIIHVTCLQSMIHEIYKSIWVSNLMRKWNVDQANY